MRVLGIRCSNSDFAYAILDGTKDTPEVIHLDRLQYPVKYSEPEQLHWFYQELTSIISKYAPAAIVIKEPEPLAKRSNSLDSRLHFESIALMVAASNGIKHAGKKPNSTIAKDLGVKGRGKYLKTLDTSFFYGFDSQNEKVKEAILAGWSGII
ncbi:MAG: hypothetical protein ABSG91_21265 [Syntrophobacteraceae bacterium]|jgi:Holliday junction resolvasome RuvABC endonuclease subunit